MRSTCAVTTCGKAFEAKRSDARYCSAACRAKASRARRRGEPLDEPPSNRAAQADLEAAESSTTTSTPFTRTDVPLDSPAADDERLGRIEERLMDLESDVEVAERERNGLLEIRHRLEGHLRRAGHAADEAESRVDAAIGPIRKQLPELATQAELAALRSEVYRLDSRLDSFEDRGEVQQPVDRRLAEVERAAITLSRRLARLRREVDAIVEAFAQAG